MTIATVGVGGDDIVTTSWRSWRLSSGRLGVTGVSDGVGVAEHRQAVRQQHVPLATDEVSEVRSLQHESGCCFEQHADFGFELQHDLASGFEQHLLAAGCPHPQLAAGKDCTRSITTAIQALA